MDAVRPRQAFDASAPLNSLGGMPLGLQGPGPHYDPCQTQRVIGRHVYIFRRTPDSIDVWRLEKDRTPAHWWALVHRFRAEPAAHPVQLALTGEAIA